MGELLLSLDQGTSSSRAVVYTPDGRELARAQCEFAQHYPRPGWVEHDPDEIWETQLRTAREALTAAHVSASDLAAIGIANQRETLVAWDRVTGQPVGPAIVWQCRRTADECDKLAADGFGVEVAARTGLVIDPYFSATKMRWVLDHRREARALADRGRLAFGTVDSWLIYRLTAGAVHRTDRTNASRTMLFNIHNLDWDPTLCEAFGVRPETLPEPQPSVAAFGEADARLLGAAVPIAGVAGDQQAALFGQGCITPGQAKNTYGTGCFVLLHTGPIPVHSDRGLLTTVAASAGAPAYALEGSIFVAGAAIQWLRDGLGVIQRADEVDALAGSVPDSGGAVFVPAFVGLGAPYWDARARGAIVGITRGTTRAHLARAALEAIAVQSAELIELLEVESGFAVTELRADGGAAASDLLMELQADVLDRPVVRAHTLETTAL